MLPLDESSLVCFDDQLGGRWLRFQDEVPGSLQHRGFSSDVLAGPAADATSFCNGLAEGEIAKSSF